MYRSLQERKHSTTHYERIRRDLDEMVIFLCITNYQFQFAWLETTYHHRILFNDRSGFQEPFTPTEVVATQSGNPNGYLYWSCQRQFFP